MRSTLLSISLAVAGFLAWPIEPRGQAAPVDPPTDPLVASPLGPAGPADAPPADAPPADPPPAEAPPDRSAADAAPAPAPAPAVTDPAGEVIEITGRSVPGSVQSVATEELERFEYTDVHRILAAVPGVYIREEDGYGLRPNIGMRGSGSERSAKIALMEDGVLIAPAPYSAPAAYYFPLVTRMARIDVLKGPSSIEYGPNTVGGAVNLISRPIPRQRELTLDLAGGAHRFGKVHVTAAESRKHVAVMIEVVKLRTDGFKELDGGGSTGFDKNDAQLKLRLASDSARAVYHQVDLKLGYSDEVSDETYTGLANSDFERAPYRRYAGTQLDRMEWRHIRVQLDHEVDFEGRLRLRTTLYRNGFTRDWKKLNGFADSDLASILANPAAPRNAVYYGVLTGAMDSTSPSENLIIGTNARDFVSQGIQLTGSAERATLGARHAVTAGLRFHTDTVKRFHFEETYAMVDGALSARSDAMTVTRDGTGSARALAGFIRDRVRVGPVVVTAGVRGELVETDADERTPPAGCPDDYREGAYSVVIPGVGAVYELAPAISVLAGVHRGFVPVAPGQCDDARPEDSVNYEAGARLASPWLSAEAIGFFSDYSNLKGTCSFSSGCAASEVDDEFNGGAVHVLGLELVAAAEFSAWRLQWPVKLSYTYNRSRFQSSFTSANPLWGDVEAGDELPYLPTHQLALSAGVAGQDWEVTLSGRHSSAMRDTAGQGPLDPLAGTDDITVVDAAANYTFDRWGTAYVTVDNLLDQAHVVARRPFGARPGKPRTIIIGYKNRF